jgi:hypothetical protein
MRKKKYNPFLYAYIDGIKKKHDDNANILPCLHFIDTKLSLILHKNMECF